MEFSEKMIEDLIVNSIQSGNTDKLSQRGLFNISQYDKFFRQFDLGDYGRLDMVGIKFFRGDCVPGERKVFRVNVIEIKKGEININAFTQALRYCKGIEVLLDRFNIDAVFEITLIGTTICKGDFIYVSDYMHNLKMYTVSLDLELGIKFNIEKGYSLTNPKKSIVSEVTLADLKKYMVEKTKQYVLSEYPF